LALSLLNRKNVSGKPIKHENRGDCNDSFMTTLLNEIIKNQEDWFKYRKIDVHGLNIKNLSLIYRGQLIIKWEKWDYQADNYLKLFIPYVIYSPEQQLGIDIYSY
jgi:hypothetical protein